MLILLYIISSYWVLPIQLKVKLSFRLQILLYFTQHWSFRKWQWRRLTCSQSSPVDWPLARSTQTSFALPETSIISRGIVRWEWDVWLRYVYFSQLSRVQRSLYEYEIVTVWLFDFWRENPWKMSLHLRPRRLSLCPSHRRHHLLLLNLRWVVTC